MRKIPKLLKEELVFAKKFFFHTHRGPLIGIILIVAAIPLATFLVSPTPNTPSESISVQIQDDSCFCTEGGEWGNPNPATRACGELLCGSNGKIWACNYSAKWQESPTGCGNTNNCTGDGDCGGQEVCSDKTRTCTPAGKPVPNCGATPRLNMPAGMKDCPIGSIMDDKTGKFICSDYTGYATQEVCGSNGKGYKCNGTTGVWDLNPKVTSCGPKGGVTPPPTNPPGTWAAGCNVAPRTTQPAGQYDCPWGDVINHNDGKALCSTAYTFTGFATQPVCGSDKKGYICDGATGLWKLNPAVPSCGPGSGGCPDTWDSNGKPVVGATNGTKICGNSGNANDPKKYNYTCENGKWSAAQGECSQQNTGCTCTGGSVKINGSVNNNYTAKCGDVVCGSDNKGYTCTFPGGDYTSYKYSSATCAGSTTPQPPGTNPTPTTGVGTPTPTPVIPTGATNPTATNTPVPNAPTATNTPVPTGTNPTATSVPGSSNLVFFLTVDGIGINTGIGQNNNPTPNTRTAGVQVINSSGTKVFDSAGDLSYNSQTGAFTGKVNIPNLTSGIYNIRTRFNNTLWKKIPRVLTAGQDNNLPSVKLINGDVNEDNAINLLDYNIMIGCFKNQSCAEKTTSDLNMDGRVTDVDINILYSHFRNREGD